MDTLARALAVARPIDDEPGERLLEPFCQAFEFALHEVTQTEPVRLRICQLDTRRLLGEFSTGIELVPIGFLALGCSWATATALAGRTLRDTQSNADPSLIQDCAGELANIVAGQAKSLLFGTPFHFNLTPPRTSLTSELDMPSFHRCLAAVFETDVGQVALQLFLSA